MKPLALGVLLAAALPFTLLTQHEGHEPSSADRRRVWAGLICKPPAASAVSVDFDRALALLHNFWYARAFDMGRA
jgi:hypothetical protein